jgi:hypothetical protein
MSGRHFQVLAFGMPALLHVRGLAGRDAHVPELLLRRRSAEGILLIRRDPARSGAIRHDPF